MKKLLLSLLLGINAIAIAQNYPVQCTPIISPPYSLRLTDYGTSGKLFRVQLLLKDLTKPSVSVSLRFRLETIGMVIGSQPDFILSEPITLLPGIPRTISGADVPELFYAQNLVAQGIDPDILSNGGSLPGGLYSWYVEAYETDRGRQVSNTGSALMSVYQSPPPQINFPQHQSTVAATSPQNVLVSWTPRHTASLNATGNTVYTMRLYELPDEPNATQQTANANMMASSGMLPYIEITTTQPYATINAFELPLIPGKQYAIQVQVSQLSGQDIFENEGKTEVVTFTYGSTTCTSPSGATATIEDATSVHLKWEAVTGVENYEVRYHSLPDGPWTQTTVSQPEALLLQLPAKTHEWQVRSLCANGQSSAYTNLDAFDLSSTEDSSLIDPDVYVNNDLEYVDTSLVQENGTPEEDIPTFEDTPFTVLLEGEIAPEGLRPIDGLGDLDPKTATTDDILNAMKAIKPKCTGFDAPYDCENHSTVPIATAGELIEIQTGDELSLSGMKFQIVDFTGSATGGYSGRALIKVPYLNHNKIGVAFTGIKVREGGCVVEGRAAVSDVDVSVLSAEMRAKVDVAYAAYKATLAVVKENSGTVAKVFNSVGDLIENIKANTQSLIEKIDRGEKISKKEKEEIQKLEKLANEKIKQSTDFLVKKWGTKGAEEILEVLQGTSTDCVCLAETSNMAEPKKGPSMTEDNLYLYTEDCKTCLEENKKKLEKKKLYGLALQKKLDNMKQNLAECGCGWGSFETIIQKWGDNGDCEEIVGYLNKAKKELKEKGETTFTMQQFLFGPQYAKGQVSIGDICIDKLKIEMDPVDSRTGVTVMADKLGLNYETDSKGNPVYENRVEVKNNKIYIKDYEETDSDLITIQTDNGEQAVLLERWLFDVPKPIVKKNIATSYSKNLLQFLITEETVVKHVYNDYKGAKSYYCKEHEGHKSFSGDKCEESSHWAEIKKLDIKGYGNPTIGVGHLIVGEGDLLKWCNKGEITDSDVKDLLGNDLESRVTQLNKALGSYKPTQCQYDAMLSIVFNRGIGKENGAGFKSSQFYKEYIKKGNFDGENEDQKADIKTALINDGSKLKNSQRRKNEAELYFNCKY